MHGLLKLSAVIDRILTKIAWVGSWAGLVLVLIVCYDVVSRYFGVPKPFGLNSTQIQESEYWLHTVLFSLVIGYAYIRQAHVRIDLIRDRLSPRKKFLIEILGCVFFLIPFTLVVLYYQFFYALTSFQEGEASKSVIGLTNIWILKSFLVAMFVLLLLAAISQLIKAVAGYLGYLSEAESAKVIGGQS